MAEELSKNQVEDEVTKFVDPLAEDAAEDETQAIEMETQAIEMGESAPMPTERLETVTEEIPAPVTPTTPMPNPHIAPQDTTPMPEPVVTTAGFDVPVTPVPSEEPPVATPVIPAGPQPVPTAPPAPEGDAYSNPATTAAPADPYAPAAAAAAAPAFAAAAKQVSPGVGTYAQPDYQPASYAQPNYTQGAYQNAVPHQPFTPDPTVNPYEYSITGLTGGMKFGWLLVGLFLNIPGMLIAWLTNVDKHPQVKKDAITWSVVGFGISIALGILFTVILTGILAAAASSLGGYYF